jgi:hypothetical protein
MVVHGGCGGALMHIATCLDNDLLRESRSWRYSRRKILSPGEFSGLDASDRMSCHSARPIGCGSFFTPPPSRGRPRLPALSSRQSESLIKIATRVVELIARIRVQLPTSGPEGALFRTVALGLLSSGLASRGRSIPNLVAQQVSLPSARPPNRQTKTSPR